MSKKLIELSKFNRDQSDLHRRMNDPSPRPNGIACPKCGVELMDSQPMMMLASNPPQKNIHCSTCDYKGLRYA